MRTADVVELLHHHPALPRGYAAMLEDAAEVDRRTLPPTDARPRLDLGYVVSVLLQQAV